MDDVLESKILALFTLWVLITFSTALPIKLSTAFQRLGSKGDEILSTLMCFGGGVFLGAYLLHLGPEGVDLMNEYLLEENNIEFPLGEFFVAIGFFMVMITEQFVHKLASKSDGSVTNPHSGDEKGDTNTDLKDRNQPTDLVRNNTHYHSHTQAMQTEHLGARSIILLVALSMDCIFEGITTGLEDSVGDVWKMVAAIMSHEFVIAFGLGLELVKHHSPLKTLVLSVIYGVTCPIGVAIGIIISESGSDESKGVDITSAILICIAGGVFLYVTFFQILQNEVGPNMKVHRIAAIIIGFLLISLLIFVVPTTTDDEIIPTDNSTLLTIH